MIRTPTKFRAPGTELTRTKSEVDEGPLGKELRTPTHDAPVSSANYSFSKHNDLERKFTSSYSSSRLDPYRNNSLQTSDVQLPKIKAHRSNPSVPLFTESSNNDKDKRRLVRQFYNSPAVNSTQTSLVNTSVSSGVNSTPSSKNKAALNFSFVSPEGRTSRTSSHFDPLTPSAQPSHLSDNEEEVSDRDEQFSLRKEVARLETLLMDTIKNKIARVEMENHQLMDQLQIKYTELDNLNREINGLYNDLSEDLKVLKEKDYSQFTTSKEATEKQTSGVLGELDTKLSAYKEVLRQEKEFIGKLGSDIGLLEKAKMSHYQSRKYRQKLIFFCTSGLVLSVLFFKLKQF
ncbi:unnamed protein product [Kuraishia capsulata CBS 1993]|uniref:Uncharacterized protein n=1 Tax=Kuraishia capsulata CBS 1993 TaxID=1382522 RepID=W6MMM6_9ASCO|nr:uncharacterized protein KUCA_T00003833001 [Kuraishia capsulata CBS 1993]CDK27854.1 unnamed protein product [Kuraishia capsulata CBS 1993]